RTGRSMNGRRGRCRWRTVRQLVYGRRRPGQSHHARAYPRRRRDGRRTLGHDRPGAHARSMRLRDLTQIYQMGGGRPDSTSLDNIELQYFDALLIFSQQELRDQRYIEVAGEVRKPGVLPVFPSMTVKDLLYLVGGPKQDADLNNIELSILTEAENFYIPNDEEESSIQPMQPGNFTGNPLQPGAETAELGSTELGAEAEGLESGQEVVRRIQVNGNWENDPVLDTMLIYGFDRLQIYSKYDFLNFQYIEVEGAVKRPGRYQLQRGMSLKDILYQAGGLTDSADVNEIELYQDIDLNERGNFNTRSPRKEIVRVEIEGENWQESIIADTIFLNDFYRVVIRSESDFFQQGFVQVKGLVNAPGEYAVGPNMTLKDVLYQAEGIQMTADFQRVELSRVVETLSETGEVIPVPIVVSAVPVNQNWQEDSTLDQIEINAFDQIMVRRNPDFELQESIFVRGEVLVDGEYHKTSRNESLTSFIGRAGGVTNLAYLEGAYILRPEIGKISIRLEKALRRPGSKWDIPLLVGDSLIVPPRTDIVSITGNVLRPGVNVLYEPSKRKFKYYVNLAGGFDRRSRRNTSTVTYADGSVKGVRHFLIFRRYPKVEQGSVIFIDVRPPRKERSAGESFSGFFQEITAQLTAALTFILLIDRTLNNP
ncbi:MAG: SLBB domain-containing protein, partial [Bacteroidota bacterium]